MAAIKAKMFRGAPGKVFILLCAMYFIEYVDRVNLSVAAPLIKQEFGLSNTRLGVALAAFGYCYAIFQIICGYLGDRLGPRRMLALSGVVWALVRWRPASPPGWAAWSWRDCSWAPAKAAPFRSRPAP